MRNFTLILKLLLFSLKQVFTSSKSIDIEEPKKERVDCFLDSCNILGNEFISLKNKIIYIDYNKKQKFEYVTLSELLKSNPAYNSIIKKILIKKIYLHYSKKHPDSLLYLEPLFNTENNDQPCFKFNCHIIDHEQFIRLFTDSTNSAAIREVLDNEGTVGIRYLGYKKSYSAVVNHYMATSLISDNGIVEHDKHIELYSNFKILIDFLGYKEDDIFEFILSSKVDKLEIDTMIENEDEIFDFILGDNNISDIVEDNFILKS